MEQVLTTIDQAHEIWANHWLKKTREYNQSVEHDSQSIRDLQELFEQLIDGHTALVASTRRDYCCQMLFYCDLTNDWRVWPQWAESLLPAASPEDKVWLLHGVARYYSEYDRYDESFAAHAEGIELCDQVGQAGDGRSTSYWRAAHFTGMSIVLQRKGDYDRALAYSRRSVAIFEELGETYRHAYALANLASCHERKADHGPAIAHYLDAIELLKEIDNQFELGMVYYSLGISYTFDNQAIEAAEAFDRSIELCSQSRNLHQLSNAYYGRAMLNYRLGRFDQSKADMERSFRTFQEANRDWPSIYASAFPVTQGNKFLFAGALYVKTGELETALTYLHRAEEFYRLSEANEVHLAKVDANRARVYERYGDLTGDYGRAEERFVQLVETGKHLHSPSMVGDAAVHLVRIYRKRRASLAEWVRLMRRLGLKGVTGLASGVTERLVRDLKLRRAK